MANSIICQIGDNRRTVLEIKKVPKRVGDKVKLRKPGERHWTKYRLKSYQYIPVSTKGNTANSDSRKPFIFQVDIL
jgi:hypothetical protein